MRLEVGKGDHHGDIRLMICPDSTWIIPLKCIDFQCMEMVFRI